MSEAAALMSRIENEINTLYDDSGETSHSQSFQQKRLNLISTATQDLPPSEQARILREFDGLGPLEPLIADGSITEIVANGPDEIWFEKDGRLTKSEEQFLSPTNYQRAMENILHEASVETSLESPCAEGAFRDFRLHAIRPPISSAHFILSLRRHPKNPWTLSRLIQSGWCTESEGALLSKAVQNRWNLLVIGNTGAGKTSVTNSLLALSNGDRCVIMEDSPEIVVPPGPSLKLLTRRSLNAHLPDLDHTDLLRNALRLRPDRLVIGEIRGGEAKDFLLALSTGHAGSLSTMHAESASQALIRLEMLVQMGAPQWSLTTVRKLIRMSVHGVVVTTRTPEGRRHFSGLYRISSLENEGFLVDKVDEV